MSEPPENAFIGWTSAPTEAELARALGAAKPLWDRIVSDLAVECGADVREWNSYSPKSGWALRLKLRKRVIVYLAPCTGCFRAAFTLSDRAIAAARAAKPGNRLQRLLDAGQRYPEGTAVRLEIHRASGLALVKKLAAIKVAS